MGKKSPSPPAAAKRPPGLKRGSSKDTHGKVPSWLKLLIGGLILPVIFAVFGYKLHQEWVVLPGIVSTVSDLPAASRPELYSHNVWGSYRSNLYFGLRAKTPKSPLFGMMWFSQPRKGIPEMPKIRHWCSQHDGLVYSWEEHDAKTYGAQTIMDHSITLHTRFITKAGGNTGGDWSARIDVQPTDPETNSSLVHTVIVYLALPEHSSKDSWLKPILEPDPRSSAPWAPLIQGRAPHLQDFQMKIMGKQDNVLARSYAAVELPNPEENMAQLNELVLSAIGKIDMPQSKHLSHLLGLVGHLPKGASVETPVNFVAVQLSFLTATSIDIVFESNDNPRRVDSLTGDNLSSALDLAKNAFEQRFEQKFNLKHKAVPYGPLSLVASVPSRPFFPRGFLWDEGFHQLLINRWDLSHSLDMIGSWLDLLNIQGWIPRELVLGSEAESKVPAEFLVQHSNIANPPVFYWLLDRLMLREGFIEQHKHSLQRLYPRLDQWYNWLNRTQQGDLPGTYRWRGRNHTTLRELNPKTLASGLDDYPRASHPSDTERHLDLFCWMRVATRCMAKMAGLLQKESDRARYEKHSELLNDAKHLLAMHWSTDKKRFADFGRHTQNVQLRRPQPQMGKDGRVKPQTEAELQRHTLREPVERLVTDTFGYVSIYPLLLQLIEPESDHLGYLLADLQNEDLLWSEFGLRSLATTSPLYNTRNTEHDPPYWRGHVWININYMALAALRHYADVSVLHGELAYTIYGKLRSNLLATAARNLQQTGFLWEHYDDRTGKGEGCHPFTGWTSLLLLILSEQYD